MHMTQAKYLHILVPQNLKKILTI